MLYWFVVGPIAFVALYSAVIYKRISDLNQEIADVISYVEENIKKKE